MSLWKASDYLVAEADVLRTTESEVQRGSVNGFERTCSHHRVSETDTFHNISVWLTFTEKEKDQKILWSPQRIISKPGFEYVALLFIMGTTALVCL